MTAAATAAPPVAELLSLAGRRVLVTGASGGIGAACAERLAEAGSHVICLGRSRPGAAERLAVRLRAAGRSAEAATADLSVPGSGSALLDRIGPVHLLLHAAARQDMGPLAEARLDAWQEMLAANLSGPAALLSACAAQGSETPFEAAVLVSSIEASAPLAGHGAYAASKAGLESLVRSAAAELAPIRVNGLAPGLTRRDELSEQWPEGLARWNAACPLGRPADPAEIADAALFLLSPAARFITGRTLAVDGGLLAGSGW